MNNIYDFSQIGELERQRKRLIFGYVIYALFVLGIIVSSCFVIENNILLTLIFALALLVFIFSSIVFWKIKYSILRDNVSFLENMEIGNKSDFVGVFLGVEPCENDAHFDKYTFEYRGGRTTHLIHKSCSVGFNVGEKYHTEQVGSYIFRWEKYENR